jgi:F0F1-type ATP synthase assembly protein I
MPPQEPDRRTLGTYYAIAQVGLEMVVPVALGWWIDDKLGTSPWILVAGVILGFVVGITHLVVLSRPPSNGNGTPKGKEP